MDRESENRVPYFCWDRNLTEKEIGEHLHNSSGVERDRLIAWILREAAFKMSGNT